LRWQVLPELEAVSPADVESFLPSLLRSLHVEALLHGNIAAQEAAELARKLHATLGQPLVAADARPAERCVQLPKGCNLLHRRAWVLVQLGFCSPGTAWADVTC
jgi:secreted Zn-dependent insulinase-like peptidase